MTTVASLLSVGTLVVFTPVYIHYCLYSLLFTFTTVSVYGEPQTRVAGLVTDREAFEYIFFCFLLFSLS